MTAGAEAESNFGAGSAAALAYLRLVSLGLGEFEVFSSSDGINWISRTKVTNAALASGILEVGLWAGCYTGGNAVCTAGTTRFESAEIILGVPAGDYNEDGTIDAADYVLWRDTNGQAVTAWDGADGTGDGMVTQEDYDVWRTNFGKTIPNLGSGSSLVPVPEPSAAESYLLWSSILCLWVGHRAHRTGHRLRKFPRTVVAHYPCSAAMELSRFHNSNSSSPRSRVCGALIRAEIRLLVEA